VERRQILFSPEWKIVGDSDWMLRVIKAGARFAALGRFTSVFVNTGRNLSLEQRAQAEAQRFWASAPRRVRLLRWPVLVHHRLRRLFGGVYSQRPFEYSLYTRESPSERRMKQALKPTFRWRW
jgi:hypothetical protein